MSAIVYWSVRVAAWSIFGLLMASASFTGTTISVWPVDSLVKVFGDDPPGTHRAPDQSWLMARNGHASLQFAVRSTVPVEALSVKIFVPGLSTAVRRVGYVPVRAKPPASPVDELARLAPARFPDPLYEGSPFGLPANETTAVWITVYAPAGARPGLYKGRVVFRSGMRRFARLPVRVRVTRATVPPKQTLKVTTWFDLDETNMARYYDFAGHPERYWELLANVARVIADHKQNVILTPVLSLTDARVEGGSLCYDFSRLDRWIEIFRTAGAADLIEGGHIIERASG